MEDAAGGNTPREGHEPPPAAEGAAAREAQQPPLEAENDEPAISRHSMLVHFTSMRGPSMRDVEEEETQEKLKFLSYGSLLGIFTHVFAIGFSEWLVLCTLMAGLVHGKRQIMPCELGSSGLETTAEVMACEYTQAYMNTFPAIGGIVLTMTVGRDILFMRTYYGLLPEGGVMSFAGVEAWRDWLIRLLLLNFSHSIAFTIIQFAALSRELELPLMRTAEAVTQASLIDLGLMPSPPAGAGDKQAAHQPFFDRQQEGGFARARRGMVRSDTELVYMCVTTMFPMVLLVVFMFVYNNIEKSLVPLSEYLKSYEALQKNIPPLITIPDFAVKRYVAENPGPRIWSASALRHYYKGLVITHHVKHGASLGEEEGEEEPPEEDESGDGGERIGLFQAFWPAKLLMRGEDRNFRFAYFCWAMTSFVWLVMIQIQTITLSERQCMNLFIEYRWQAIPPMLVLTFYSVILMWIACVLAKQCVMFWTHGSDPEELLHSQMRASSAPA